MSYQSPFAEVRNMSAAELQQIHISSAVAAPQAGAAAVNADGEGGGDADPAPGGVVQQAGSTLSARQLALTMQAIK